MDDTRRLSNIRRGKEILASDPNFGKYILPHEFDGLADAIKTMQTLKEARKCIDDMDFLKDCLDHAKRFGEFASQFCVMEARMYLNIAQLSMTFDEADPLTKGQRNIVNWVREQDDEEVACLIAECESGQRITKLYRDHLACIRVMKKQAECRDVSDRIIREAREQGKTTLTVSRFYDEFPANMKPQNSDIKAYTELTRDELLRIGAVGLGDGSGTYIIPSKDNRDEVMQAVMARLDSIAYDIRNLLRLCERAGLVFPITKLRKITNEISRLRTEEVG